MKNSEFVDRIIEKHIEDEELKRLLITHSSCVARKALDVADRCGLVENVDRQFLWDASMLHDIGVVECDAPGIHCFGRKPYICHGIAGAEILKKEGLSERFSHVCERHTGAGITSEEVINNSLPLPIKDYLPETIEEKLICYADKFFSKSATPDVEKDLEKVMRSMARHGEGVLKRFMELHETFQPNNK